MTSFEDRRKGFEKEFERNQELAFRITVRRNRLFGLWAAERLGLPADQAEAYARTVVEADFQAPGDSDVIAKVKEDLAAVGISLPEPTLRTELERAVAEARRQLASS